MNPTGKMKALAYNNYGKPDVLHFRDLVIPIPKKNQVLVKVYAVSINTSDIVLMEGVPYIIRLATGICRPRNKILGTDFSGIIAGIGKEVSEFKTGDNVYGAASVFENGCFAEYVCVATNVISHKPKTLSFEEAAAIPTSATTALKTITKKLPNESKKRILIDGASGGLGTFAIQIAKALDCEVTAVCSTKSADTARCLGADYIFDDGYIPVSGKETEYDLVYTIKGDSSIFDLKKSLSKGEAYSTSDGSEKQALIKKGIEPFTSTKKTISVCDVPTSKDLIYLNSLVYQEKLHPVIDQIYQKEELVDAVKHFCKGGTTGKVVVSMVSKK